MTEDRPIALIALTETGATTARRAQTGLPGAVLFGRHGRVAIADRGFENTIICIRTLYAEGWTVIGVCATGILIRALCDLTQNKWRDAPVLALSEDGAVVVPLLGGHRGANQIAMFLAESLGGVAAITTAGDRKLSVALDDPPDGWTLRSPEAVKAISATLLAGKSVRIRHECGDPSWPETELLLPVGPGDNAEVLVTDRSVAPAVGQVVLVPPTLALGVGCERNAPEDGLIAFIRAMLDEAGLDAAAVGAIGTVDLKADEAAMKGLSSALGRPLRLFSATTLETLTPHLPNPSNVVFQEIGCHGVAEASALALAGRDACFVVEKQRRGLYTCAIARAQNRSVDLSAGRTCGKLYVIGLGPGDPAQRTAAATQALLRAEAVVGYRLYLDLAADLIGDKPVYESGLGAEEERAAKALALAAEGRTVALVCSGDPGIYALASLVVELLADSTSRAVRGVDVEIVPGISAFQLAAARLGAPMGHDFCLISLSDLLTPADAIRARLQAAAEGDFVIALYNPQSQRRRALLTDAKSILNRHRSPETPVAVCRQLGRPDESITVTTLPAFDVESVDMLALVVVGSSTTRSFDLAGTQRTFTPRGYASKRDKGAT